MLKIGLVGFPNVGKSTLFNALTRLGVATAAYPFTTVEPHHGTVVVPDDFLSRLAEVSGAKRQTPATFTLIDVAGLVRGAHRGEGLGNEFLSHLRRVDALLHVVRVFEEESVVRAGGSTDPASDIAAIRAELAEKDKEIASRHPAPTKRKNLPFPLAKLPVLYVFNIGEEQLTKLPLALRQLMRQFQPAIALAAKIEAELQELSPSERANFQRAYGVSGAAISQLIHQILQVARQKSFYTVNENEARAWLVPAATTAVEAAEKVHSAFAKQFIRAEAVPPEVFLREGSWKKVRERGLASTLQRNSTLPPRSVVYFHTGKTSTPRSS
jgi:hypothetical protein